MMVKIHIAIMEITNIEKKYKNVYPKALKENTRIEKRLKSVEYRSKLPNIPNGKAANIIEIIHNITHIFHPNEIDDFTLYDNGR